MGFLAVIVLAALSAGGVAYAFLYGRIQDENTTEKRLDFIQGKNRGEASARGAKADPGKRRKSVQDTLKELEQNQKAKAKKSSSPPLLLRMQQAGLSWTRRKFLVISLISVLLLGFLERRFGKVAR